MNIFNVKYLPRRDGRVGRLKVHQFTGWRHIIHVVLFETAERPADNLVPIDGDGIRLDRLRRERHLADFGTHRHDHGAKKLGYVFAETEKKRIFENSLPVWQIIPSTK